MRERNSHPPKSSIRGRKAERDGARPQDGSRACPLVPPAGCPRHTVPADWGTGYLPGEERRAKRAAFARHPVLCLSSPQPGAPLPLRPWGLLSIH